MSQTVQNLISRTVGYGVFHRRLGANRRVFQVFHDLVQTQFESREFFREAQLAALKALLIHAGKHVPYYRKLFAQTGFDPSRIKDVAELKQLPRLTKQIIRAQSRDLIADNAERGRLTRNFTGGSTGAATEFYQDTRYQVHRGGTSLFSNYLTGWRPGMALARLWGAPRDLDLHTTRRARLRNYFYNNHQFNTFELSKQRLAQYHERLSGIWPGVLVCYASAAYRLAQFLQETSLKPQYPTRGLVTSAEALQPHMRRLIEEVFPVRVFDRYACRELSCLASECDAHTGHHVHMLSNVVEIDTTGDNDTAGADGAGEGDVLVTGLHNYAMPFIRYEIGDRATVYPGECPCGRGMEMIGAVAGRITDFLIGHDGNYIAGPSLTVLFYGVDSILQYQLVQEDYNRFSLKVVPTDKWDGAEMERLLDRLRLHLGAAANIEISRVSSIPLTKTGKFRFIICNLRETQSQGVGVCSEDRTELLISTSRGL